ncbi:MAG: DEAD/DEAH box helicase family protein [Desulfobacterales bacterium]|nr:DEAD/DEAH box helicase family protein [Desulfobacterales bacterium]
MAKRPKRQKAIKRLNLSDHTLDINIRRCNYSKFNFSDIEDYVHELVGSRDYQYKAIKQVMIYLWGGSYKSIADLGKENFNNVKERAQIQQRFGTEASFLNNLPLPDRLSGVVHMATGTGKSYVIFAIAYLSLVMGLTKRVLVLGPASTIIEQGLREKFKELKNKREFNSKLPQKYRGKAINLLTDNDPIEDDSIVIENINAVYTFGGITDTLFKNTDEVLVLGDEIHHAYSHLKYADNRLVLDKEEGPEGKKSEARDERLWIKFLRENSKITRHIGFTGTPYNQNEYFADIIFNYSIKDATEEKYIKKINSIIRTETDEGDDRLTIDQRFEMVLKNHLENRERYTYKTRSGKRIVKPITIFICPNIKNAQRRYDEFVGFLTGYEKKHHGIQGTDSEIMDVLRKKVICVVSRVSKSEYKQELDNIEETDPKKVGGSVEFIFAVNKLSEGWDVDNVFQIVPMEERVFNSKLLISQVLGRGMRIPRNVPNAHILQKYPELTVTNHDKFADHIKELVDSVTESDMYLASAPLTDREQGRGTHNFTLFNLNYIPNIRFEKADHIDQGPPGKLILTPFEEKLGVKVIRTKDEKRYELARNFYTVDQIVYDNFNRFKFRTFEALHFDFGSVVVDDRYPEEDEISQVVREAMEEAGIKGDKLSGDNRKQIDIYFSQFLPRGKKKRVFENIEGDLIPIDTSRMDRSGIRVGELERDRTAFLSEDYETEVGDTNKFVLEYINELRGRPKDKRQLSLFKPEDFVESRDEIIRPFVKGDTRPPYVVNTSKLKSPQNIVLVSHSPEKEFVFQLIEDSDYIDSWIKSPDKNFYSIDYEYWKGGKDRVRRSFNPDFFIKIDLDEYISSLESEGTKEHLEELKKLQDEGIETLIKVVEIKPDEEQDEATPAKEDYAKTHFERVNSKLSRLNLADLESRYQSDARQHYTFDLLTPYQFPRWFSDLRKGGVDI